MRAAPQVTSAALEKVRAVKNSMTRLATRVARMKSELEHIMDDDQDMLVNPPCPPHPLSWGDLVTLACEHRQPVGINVA